MGKAEPDVEVLELAIAREVEAYKLYMRMSLRASDQLMKDLLVQFAGEELGHKARLELELMKLGIVVKSPDETPSYKQDEDDDSDEGVLEMDYKDMLLFAMRKERTAFRLYVDLAALTKDKASREMLLTLAEDEAMHQARFEVEYNILMRKQSK